MTTQSVGQKNTQQLPRYGWVRLILVYLFIPALLFGCDGDLRWWQGWVFTSIILIAGIASRLLAEHRHPGLLMERQKSFQTAGMKPWDKILAPLMATSISFPLVILAGLDHRFNWSSAFPVGLNLLGFFLMAGGYAFASWALAENRWFSGVVRIQTDRGHAVCDCGPYRIVRHPGYSGNILPLPGIALALSSTWTFIPAAVALVIIVIRTVLEDRTLREELPGYQDYARRVRYRLFPGIY